MNIYRQITTYKFVQQQIKDNPSTIVMHDGYQFARAQSGIVFFQQYSIGDNLCVVKQVARSGKIKYKLTANGQNDERTGVYAKLIFDMLHDAYTKRQARTK
jgi:hypothetical protein